MPEVPEEKASVLVYRKCPKYTCHELTTEQVEAIALRAAKLAVDLVKTEAITATGSFVISKVSYIVGITALGTLAYLSRLGLIEWR